MTEMRRGIDRSGLDADFVEAEGRKSQLIFEARQRLDDGLVEEAAQRFAAAAELEHQLAEYCSRQGLMEKAFIHEFSAVSCWAQAGNLYEAIVMCDQLLSRNELPERLRSHIVQYRQTLRNRRSEWHSELLAHSAEPDL